MKKIIRSFDSFKYHEVWKILEWRDGYVWKVESIGFIHRDNTAHYPKEEYELSSISTRLTGEDTCTLSPFIEH